MKTHLVFTLCCLLNAANIYVNGRNEDYILNADVNCGPDGKVDAVVSVLTDVGLTPKAICSQDDGHLLLSSDGVHFTLPVSYPGRGDSSCVFQVGDDGIYSLKLTLDDSERLPDELVKNYGIFCNVTSGGVAGRVVLLETMAMTSTVSSSTSEPTSTTVKPFEEGDVTLDMRIMNVLRQDITGRQLRDKKLIWLTLQRSEEPGLLTGLKPSSCDVIGRKTVPFLRDGCGTDQPGALGRYEGLETKGLNVTSPYFRLSISEDNAVLNFRCSFSRCSSPCDGNSCQRARRKRDVDMDMFRMEESLPFHVAGSRVLRRSPLEQRLDAFLRDRSRVGAADVDGDHV